MHKRSFSTILGLAVLFGGTPMSFFAQSFAPGPVINCAQLGEPDPGMKLETCLRKLTSGGVADARALSGNFSIAHSVTFRTGGIALLLPARSTITLQDDVTLEIAASFIRIEGIDQTTILALGSRSAIRIGQNGNPVWGWELSRLSIRPAAGRHPSTAIYLSNAREGFLQRIKVSGFSGPAIDVADNCWSDRSIESDIQENDIGFNFHGDNTNAWNVRGGMVNSNRIGINFDLGGGKVQGFSISDGTQLEANKEAAIRLQSGVILGLFLSDIYSELFNTQRLVKAEPSGQPLHLNLLSIVNAYVFSQDTPPVSVNTRAVDGAYVTVSHLLLRHSHHQLPIAEASGANTSLVVSESASTSALNEYSSNLIVNRGARAVTVREGSIVR